MFTDGQQSPGGHRGVSALDVHQFGLLEHHGTLHQAGRRFAEHHPTRRGNRLHPLGHPHLLADRGVTQWARTNLTSDHLTRIHADPQLQRDTVTAFHLSRQALGLPLNVQRGQTGAKSVILQRNRRPKERHDPVAGELVDGPAVSPHHDRTAVDQLGHDLAQPLGTKRRCDVHRMHHVGEQNRHLLVLRRFRRRGRSAALVTELGVLA